MDLCGWFGFGGRWCRVGVEVGPVVGAAVCVVWFWWGLSGILQESA